MKNRGSLSKRGPRFTRKADEITGPVMVRGDALKAGFLLRSIILFGLLLMLLEGMLADETGIRSKLPWSFQPVLPQDAFKFRDIDDYIDDSMESHGIVPNPLADRWTLIRRATFDLLGLPPSPDEVLAFVEDSSPDAYEKLVDRLLASPRYGERWGRYWLDLARYADTNGADENMAFPNAWRYRNYVIRSFNQDKPYDRFIREQIAGDLLPETDDVDLQVDRLVATGFLVLGPKMLAEQDKEKLLMDVVDEQIDVVTRTFLGISVACARCHDHKFDPVDQEDYYALAGIFRSTRTMANTDHVSRWTERVVPHPENADLQAAFELQKSDLERRIQELERSAGSEESKQKLDAFKDQLKQLEAKGAGLPRAMSVMDGDIQNLPVHLRGNHLTLAKHSVNRQSVSFLDHLVAMGDIASSDSGRLTLSDWLCDPEHPLVARVMVNRIWKGHFGEGLVSTPSNFGHTGDYPSHSELLDWLARRFVQDGYSIKSMHRRMMLSNAYRRSSEHSSVAGAIDPDNRWLWRQNRRRLEAEPLRDALLYISGRLDTEWGDSLGSMKDNSSYYREEGEAFKAPVRAVYLPVLRSRVYDMFATFDFPDASAHLEKRSQTIMPQQALFYLNGELTSQCADGLADSIQASGPGENERNLKRLYLTLFSRYPSIEEMRLFEAYLRQSSFVGTEEAKRSGLVRWIRILMASNEFSYIR